VLLVNPRSGSRRAERFGLVEKAEDLGVGVITLDQGQDLIQLAREAVDHGADCIGAAGGDGSLAYVAAVAVERAVPFVCVPSGTRNHFARDLGLDRQDPTSALLAFRDGVERSIDYASVGDRIFLNNVSLGAYAALVHQESYRDAKLGTARRLIPELLRHDGVAFDLRFTTPEGAELDDLVVLQVSNNPYVWATSPALGRRDRLDTGRLGVFSVQAGNGREAPEIVDRVVTGARRDEYFHEFTAERFDVHSRSRRIIAGIDGEAAELESPLRFRIHPRGLRMLVPSDSGAALR
jgi:diacylglycerol kinase family enzyme